MYIVNAANIDFICCRPILGEAFQRSLPALHPHQNIMKTIKNTALPGAILAFILLLTNLAPAAMNEANEPVKQLFGAAASNTSEPKELIQGFFEAIESNDIDGALKTLFKGAQLTTDAERELNAGIKKALSYYGIPYRVDLVSETPKGPVVVKFIYTQSFDSLPLSWSFFAYRNSHGWVIISAQFSDKTDLLQ